MNTRTKIEAILSNAIQDVYFPNKVSLSKEEYVLQLLKLVEREKQKALGRVRKAIKKEAVYESTEVVINQAIDEELREVEDDER